MVRSSNCCLRRCGCRCLKRRPLSFIPPALPPLKSKVEDTLELFNELQLQHQSVEAKTKTLHDACDRLSSTF